MQFLSIETINTLKDLSDLVGDRNVDYILVANSLKRSPQIKLQFDQLCQDTIQQGESVDYQKKITLLNKYTENSDIFEAIALLSSNGWKILSNLNTLPNYLNIPPSIVIPSSANTLGNNESIKQDIYTEVMNMLNTPPHIIDPGVFNEYSTIQNAKIGEFDVTSANPAYWFPVPLGTITLYSSLSNTSIDVPAYPEEVGDSTKANYNQMPDLLYQYEPWNVYESSGPRSNPYTFDLHRDMWSGNHNDGKANELIRFCQSCCYPEYNGSAVYSDIITLYIQGRPLITGIMTDFNVHWDGPILQDGWYGHFKLEFTITEVSTIPLTNQSVKNKPLIG